jgi:hypothetical protein
MKHTQQKLMKKYKHKKTITEQKDRALILTLQIILISIYHVIKLVEHMKNI